METDDELRFDRGDDVPPRLRHQFSRLLGMTAAQVHRVAHDALAAVGAHRYHFVALAVLDRSGPASQARLSDRTGVFKSDLVAVLNELAEAGYVERAPDPSDKRRNIVTITASGAERLRELDAVLDGVHERVLGPLTEPERAQLFALLGRVNAHLAEGD